MSATDLSEKEAADSTAILVALVLGNFIGLQGAILIPMWLGVSIETFGFSDAIGGQLATAELAAMAIASLLISSRMDRLDRRLSTWIGLALIVLGNLAAIEAVHSLSLPLLFVSRGVAGLGEGLVVAAVNAVAAGTGNPQRSFAFMSGGFVGIGSLAFMVAPYVIEGFSTSGVFGLMGLLAAVTAAVIIVLPGQPDKTGGAIAESESESAFNRTTIIALIGYAIANACFVSVWTFVGRIGVQSVQLDLDGVGRVLAIGTLLGIIGPVIANFAGIRWGRTLPVMAALGLYWLMLMTLSFTGVPIGYISAVFIASVVVVFFTAFMMTRFAELDPSGRIAAAGPAGQSVGNALGPVISGTAIGLMSGFAGLAVAGTLLLIVAAFMIGWVTLWLDRGRCKD